MSSLSDYIDSQIKAKQEHNKKIELARRIRSNIEITKTLSEKDMKRRNLLDEGGPLAFLNNYDHCLENERIDPLYCALSRVWDITDNDKSYIGHNPYITARIHDLRERIQNRTITQQEYESLVGKNPEQLAEKFRNESAFESEKVLVH
ncbi:MAG: hypothetical protein ABIH72_02740 [archaeon]